MEIYFANTGHVIFSYIRYFRNIKLVLDSLKVKGKRNYDLTT